MDSFSGLHKLNSDRLLTMAEITRSAFSVVFYCIFFTVLYFSTICVTYIIYKFYTGLKKSLMYSGCLNIVRKILGPFN